MLHLNSLVYKEGAKNFVAARNLQKWPLHTGANPSIMKFFFVEIIDVYISKLTRNYMLDRFFQEFVHIGLIIQCQYCQNRQNSWKLHMNIQITP